MSNPPKKACVSFTKLHQIGGGQPQTRATTAAKAAAGSTDQSVTQIVNSNKGHISLPSPETTQPDNANTPPPNTYHVIAEMLAAVIISGKLDAPTKANVDKVIKIAREAGNKEDTRVTSSGEQGEVSDTQDDIRSDLAKLRKTLENQILQIQESCNTIIENTSKVMKGVEETKTGTKDLASRVDKVTDTTDKIALVNNSYRDALVSKPASSNRDSTDPRVLHDMDRKAKQILMDIFDEDENNILTKSLTSIIDKANESITRIQDKQKPKDAKVIAALKTRGHAVLLTLNSKEAVEWIREPSNEQGFADDFSPQAHIRERTYNLIVPRVPITFDPSKDTDLREIEEVNNMDAKVIRKVR